MRPLCLWLVVSHLAGLVPAVFAGPQGGSVVGGSASIDQSVSGLTRIQQSTNRAIINWNSFSSGATERIQFQQPGATSATVNRVTGATPSILDGALDANGHVFILNANGVLFGKSAQVNVNGLTASTLDLNNAEFMSGATKLTLRQLSDHPRGAVVNQGRINAGSGGVTLVAPLVDNQGTIRATCGGRVNLGAGEEAEVSVGDANLMSLKVRAGPAGDVQMPSRGSSDALESVVNNKHFVDAGSVRHVGNDVILGGAGGVLLNEGTIATVGAPGRAAGAVKLDSTRLTLMTPLSRVLANGEGEHSDGGAIQLLSQGKTVFERLAEIEARSGSIGNGGHVEISACEGVLVDGKVDTSATRGVNGSFLIDPDFLVITHGSAGAGDQDSSFVVDGGATGIPFNGNGTVDNSQFNTVSDGKITQQLTSTNVILEARGHINFNSGVAIGLAGGNSLFFHVKNDTVNEGSSPQIFGPANGLAQISNLNATDTGKIVFVVDSGNVATNTKAIDLSNVALDGAAGGVFITAPGSITLDRVSANGATGIINVSSGGSILKATGLGTSEIVAGTQVLLAAKGGIGSSTTSLVVATPKLIVDQSAGGDVFLSSLANAPAFNGNVTVANKGGTGSFSLASSGGDITVGNKLSIATTDLTGQFGQKFTGLCCVTGLTANSGTVKLNSSGAIKFQSGGVLSATGAAAKADLTAVNGIVDTVNTHHVANLSAKNTGNGAACSINLKNDHDVTFDALNTASLGDVTLTNTAGDITVGTANLISGNAVNITAATGNILLDGKTTAGNAKQATFVATLGSINARSAGSGLITADTTVLTAPAGIGNVLQVQTSTKNLAARSLKAVNAGGNISIGNSGTSVTAAAQSDGGSVNLQGTGGDLSTGTVDTLSGVTGGGGASAGRTVSLVNTGGGDVVVTSAGDVTSSGTTIALISAKNIKLGGNVSTGTPTNGAVVDLVAQGGSITQTVASAKTTSGTVVADATAGIGAAGARLQLATSNLQLGGATVGTLVANGGDDFIINSNPAAPLKLAGTDGGNIDVLQSGNSALTVDLVTVTGAGLASPPLPTALSVAQATTLSATGGKTIALSTDTAGIDLKIPVAASGGDIGIVSQTSVQLENDVSTGAASNTHVLDVVARTGAITRTGGTLISGNVGLDAATGIGAAGAANRVATSTSNLQLGGLSAGGAVNNTGNDFIANSGQAVTVAGDTANGNLDLVQTGADLSVGHFAAGAFNLPAAQITSAARAGLAPGTAGNQVSLVTQSSGNIVVGDVVTTIGGDIGIVSIGGIAQSADVTAGTVTNANTSLVDLVARGGSITRTAGTVIAGVVAADASAGIGSATNRLTTKTGKLQAGDLVLQDEGGAAGALANTGDDFLANGGRALTLAAKTTGGNVDVTQDGVATGSQLTVGQLQLGDFAPAGVSAVTVGKPAGQVVGVSTATAGKKISLVTLTNGDIEVTSGNPVQTNAGDIALVAAKGILLSDDVRTAATTAGAATNTSLVDLVALGNRTSGPGIARTGGTVASGFVAVDSVSGVGAAAAGTRLQIDASNLQLGGLSVAFNGGAAGAVDNKGDDFIANSGTAALTVSGIDKTGGNIDLVQSGNDLIVGSPTFATFDPASPSAAKVTAGVQNGLKNAGTSNTISLVTIGSGNITVNNPVTSNDGNIGVVAAGSIVLKNDVTTQSFLDASQVDLIAMGAAGTITRPTAAGTVVAGRVALEAPGNIGDPTIGHRVQTKTSNLQLGRLDVTLAGQSVVNVANAGDDFVENVPDAAAGGITLTLAGTNTGGKIDVTQDGGTAVLGVNPSLIVADLSIGQFNPASPSAAAVSVRAPLAATLEATGVGQSISLVTKNQGDIVISGNTRSTGGDIGLISAQNISLGADVTTQSNSDGSRAFLVARAGAILHTVGAITAGTVALDATVGIGSEISQPAPNQGPPPLSRVRTSTANLQLGGLSVQDQGSATVNAVPNGGDDFVQNQGPVALTLAAVNATGVIDVTQAGALLDVNQLQVANFAPAAGNSAVVVSTPAVVVGVKDNASTKTVSLVTLGGGDIQIDKPVQTTVGDIALLSADGVKLNDIVSAGLIGDNRILDVVAQNGQILDAAGTSLLTAGRISLASSAALATNAGIGTETRRVLVSTNNLQIGNLKVANENGTLTTVTNKGDDFVDNSGPQALKLAGVVTDGVMDLTQNGAKLTVSEHLGDTFDFHAGTSADGSAAAQIQSLKQTGIQVNNATTTGKTLSLVTLGTGADIQVDRGINVEDGDIALLSSTGVKLNDIVTTKKLGALNASANLSLIDVMALNGQILDTAGTGKLVSGRVAVAASAGIGSETARLLTSTSSLQVGNLKEANAQGTLTLLVNGGDDFIANGGTTAVNLAGVVTNGVFDVTQDGANLTVATPADDTFDFHAVASVNSAARIQSVSQDGVKVNTLSGQTVSLVTLNANADLVVNSPVVTTGGDIAVVSANGVQVNSLVQTGTSNDTHLVAVVAQNGQILDGAGIGTLISGDVAVSASAGIGSETARLLTSAANLQIGNLKVGSPTAPLTTLTNTGDDFLANSGPQALKLAGVVTNGVMDITQDSAKLTVGEHALDTFDFHVADLNAAAQIRSNLQTGIQVNTITGQTLSLATLGTNADIQVDKPITTTDANIALFSSTGVSLNDVVQTKASGASTNAHLIDVVARNGQILDAVGTGKLISGSIALAASAGIGSETARVLTSTSQMQVGNIRVAGATGTLTSFTNTGDDFIANSGPTALTLAGVVTGGVFDVTQDGASLTIGTPVDDAFDFHAAGGATTDANAAVQIQTASQIGVHALTGGKTISLVTLNANADLIVNSAVTSTDGDIGLLSSTGVQVNQVVRTGTSANGHILDVVARNGRILDSSGNGVLISGSLAVEASGGIAAETARLKTSATKLQIGNLQVANASPASLTLLDNAGDDFIANAGPQAVTVAGVVKGGVMDVIQDGAALTVGEHLAGTFDFHAGASSDLSASARIHSNLQTGIIDTTAGKTISLVTLNTNADIVVNKGITSTDAAIALVSSNGVSINADVKTGNNSILDVVAENGQILDGAGTGRLISKNVAVEASGGIGSESARLLTSTSNLQIGNLQVANASPANLALLDNAGDDFLANTGAQAVKVAGVVKAGVMDVTQDGASLTVGEHLADVFDFHTGVSADVNAAARVQSNKQTGITDTTSGKTISLSTTKPNADIVVANGVTSTDGAIALVSSTGVKINADVKTGLSSNASTLDVVARGGQILDAAGTGALVSGNVAVEASAGIGSATARLLTSSSRIQIGNLKVAGASQTLALLDNAGDDFLANRGPQAAAVAGVVKNGALDVVQNGAALSVGAFAADAFDFHAAGGASTDANAAAQVASLAQVGLADTTAGKTISLVTAGSGSISIDNPVISTGGAIGVVAADSVVLGARVSTGSATDAALVDLIARGLTAGTGSLTNKAAVAIPTLTAGTVALEAFTGIGASGSRINTAASNVRLGGLGVNGAAARNAGDDFLAATGGVPVTLAGANSAGNVDVTEAGATLTVGTVAGGAFAPAGASSAANVAAASQVGLVLTGSGRTVSLVTVGAGNIVVSAPLSTNAGSMGLVAAGGVTVGGPISSGSASDAAVVDLVARSGAITQAGGLVTAGGVVVDASAGAGTAGARLQTSTSRLQIGGVSVAGAADVNAGDQFIENSGPVPVLVAGADAGSIDIRQDGATLTVGALALNAFAPAALSNLSLVGLTTTLGGGTVSLTTAGSGDVAIANTVTSASGTVKVAAAGNMVNLVAAGGNDITAVTAQLSAGGELGTPAAPIGVTVSFLNASAPNGSAAINSFRAPDTTVTGAAKNDFALTQQNGNLLLDTITAGQAINLSAVKGSILDATGGTKVNLTSTGGVQSMLSAAGTLGTRAAPLSVNFNPGKLGVAAGGNDGTGAAVNINGTVTPEFTLDQFGSFTGDVIFNGRVISGPELNTAQASPALVVHPDNPIDQTTVDETQLRAAVSAIITAAPFRQDDFVEEEPAITALARSNLVATAQTTGRQGKSQELLEATERATSEDSEVDATPVRKRSSAALDTEETETAAAEPAEVTPDLDTRTLARTLAAEVETAKAKASTPLVPSRRSRRPVTRVSDVEEVPDDGSTE